MEKYTELGGQRSFFSPRERPKLSEIGPASFLHLCVAPWSDPPCQGLGPRILSAIPEVCCPAWPWNDIHLTPHSLDNQGFIDRPASPSTCIWCVLLMLVIFIGLGPLFPIPLAVLHAAPGASCWSLSDPKPACWRISTRVVKAKSPIPTWATPASLSYLVRDLDWVA